MTKAYMYYQQSCEVGYKKAHGGLAVIILQGGEPGCGGVVNKQKARENLQMAAEAGSSRSMYNLGRMHEKGETETGVVNKHLALDWYTEALSAAPDEIKYQQKVNEITDFLNIQSTYKI